MPQTVADGGTRHAHKARCLSTSQVRRPPRTAMPCPLQKPGRPASRAWLRSLCLGSRHGTGFSCRAWKPQREVPQCPARETPELDWGRGREVTPSPPRMHIVCGEAGPYSCPTASGHGMGARGCTCCALQAQHALPCPSWSSLALPGWVQVQPLALPPCTAPLQSRPASQICNLSLGRRAGCDSRPLPRPGVS